MINLFVTVASDHPVGMLTHSKRLHLLSELLLTHESLREHKPQRRHCNGCEATGYREQKTQLAFGIPPSTQHYMMSPEDPFWKGKLRNG